MGLGSDATNLASNPPATQRPAFWVPARNAGCWVCDGSPVFENLRRAPKLEKPAAGRYDPIYLTKNPADPFDNTGS
jgi:hypothetical protein